MKTDLPSHDSIMQLLGEVMESFSWKEFKPILYSQERLKTWLGEKLHPEPEEPRMMDPDDPAVSERATVSATMEGKAHEFWAELDPEEREMIKAAVKELWGKEGAAMLPMNLD